METTGTAGSIAVLSGQRVLRQVNLDPQKRTAAMLAPAIEQLLRWCRDQDLELHFVAVADGPGSFTGLRIGVTTAKALSYALGLSLVGVDSLAAVAAAAFGDSPDCHSLLVGLDAYRSQVYCGTFDRSELLPPINAIPKSWTPHPDSVRVATNLDWSACLARRAAETQITGDAKLLGPLADQRVDRHCDAIGVGMLGIRAAVSGKFVDPMRLVPRYLKLSAAEEKSRAAGSA